MVQVLALPVEDSQFRRLPHPPRIGQHVQLPFSFVHGEVPDDASRMGIAHKQEPFQFQSHFARRARVGRTGAKLDRLLAFFGQKRSLCDRGGSVDGHAPLGARRERVGFRLCIVGRRHARPRRDAGQDSPVAGIRKRTLPAMSLKSRQAAASDVEPDLGGQSLVLAEDVERKSELSGPPVRALGRGRLELRLPRPVVPGWRMLMVGTGDLAASFRADPDHIVGVAIAVGVDEQFGELTSLRGLAGFDLFFHRLLPGTAETDVQMVGVAQDESLGGRFRRLALCDLERTCSGRILPARFVQFPVDCGTGTRHRHAQRRALVGPVS